MGYYHLVSQTTNDQNNIMTLQEIELHISQIKEEIEMTECGENRKMLQEDLQDLTNERARLL